MSGKHLFLVHWNQAEAEQYAEALRALGWRVDVEAEDGARAAKAIKADPPNVLVIYHTRLPSHGRATAAHLAEAKATWDIPVIFVGGEGQALEKTKAALAQAIFLAPEDLAETLRTQPWKGF